MDRNLPAILTGALIFLAGLGFFWLNRQIPLFADDYCRFADGFDAGTILSGVASEYMSWSGRFPVLFLTRLMLSLGETGLLVFDLLNVFFLCILGWLVLDYARMTCPPGQLLASSIVAVFLCLFWFTPERLGEVVLWKTGAVQYFWGTTIALLALKPVLDRVIADKVLPPGPARLIAWSILCILGGAWLEHLSVAVIAVWALLLIVQKFRFNRHVDAHLLIGLGCWVLGALVLILAPGNYERATLIGYDDGIITRFATAAANLYRFTDTGLILTGALFLSIQLMIRAPDLERRLWTAACLLGVGILSAMAMSVAPTASQLTRVFFPFELTTLAAVMALFPANGFDVGRPRIHRHLITGLSALALFAVVIDYIVVVTAYRNVSDQQQVREEIVQIASDNGVTEYIALPPLFFNDSMNTLNGSVNEGRYFARDITPNIDHWRNRCYANARHLDSVYLSR